MEFLNFCNITTADYERSIIRRRKTTYAKNGPRSPSQPRGLCLQATVKRTAPPRRARMPRATAAGGVRKGAAGRRRAGAARWCWCWSRPQHAQWQCTRPANALRDLVHVLQSRRHSSRVAPRPCETPSRSPRYRRALGAARRSGPTGQLCQVLSLAFYKDLSPSATGDELCRRVMRWATKCA